MMLLPDGRGKGGGEGGASEGARKGEGACFWQLQFWQEPWLGMLPANCTIWEQTKFRAQWICYTDKGYDFCDTYTVLSCSISMMKLNKLKSNSNDNITFSTAFDLAIPGLPFSCFLFFPRIGCFWRLSRISNGFDLTSLLDLTFAFFWEKRFLFLFVFPIFLTEVIIKNSIYILNNSMFYFISPGLGWIQTYNILTLFVWMGIKTCVRPK